MNVTDTKCKSKRQAEIDRGQSGSALIATALLIIALGFFITSGMQLYNIWREQQVPRDTDRNIHAIQHALQVFLAENGRLPCPARLDAPLDSPTFGREISENCAEAGSVAGTFRAPGREDRMVRTGAIPVRTLNIDDNYAFDGFRRRLVYAVTEVYASADPPLNQDRGAITVKDASGNHASSMPANLVYTLLSMGADARGAYTFHGGLAEPCNPNAKGGVNCAFGGEFVNSIHRSFRDGNMRFTSQIAYKAVSIVSPCKEGAQSGRPKDVAYLVDTSGSMSSKGQCSGEMIHCRRIDIAHWALRRAIPSRLYQNELRGETDLKTELTGFNTSATKTSQVHDSFGEIEITDPDAVEDRINSLCPSGGTPLGIHIEALAERLGDGEPDRPNVIVVISDGYSNRGTDPVTVAHRIARDFPNIQVHIIDVVGLPSLRQVAEITGGEYTLSSKPDELLEKLNDFSGVCGEVNPPNPIPDRKAC